MKEVIEHLERMAETLDGVDEENWLDTPQDIAQIYRSVANEIRQKMSAQNQSVTNCNQLQPNKVENAENNHIRLNAAKMLDALRKVISLYKSWASSGDEANSYLMSACNVAMDALSSPPRNCDVGTAEEQSDRFTKFCRLHEKGCGLGWGSKGIGNPKVTCPAYHNTECGLEWAQMPYEEVK